jgi:hypothetical protein
MKLPKGWNKTIKDLVQETKRGLRTSVNKDELDWARAYELQLLPPTTRFPKDGDVYEAKRNLKVHYMTWWKAPTSSGGDAIFYKGERVRIEDPWDQKKPLGFHAIPMDYEKVEGRMIAKWLRDQPKYDGFSISLSTLDLNKKFKLVGSKSTKGT